MAMASPTRHQGVVVALLTEGFFMPLTCPLSPMSMVWAAKRGGSRADDTPRAPREATALSGRTSRVESTSVSFCPPSPLDGGSEHYFRDAPTVKKNRRLLPPPSMPADA
jgi:hypothetical protein